MTRLKDERNPKKNNLRQARRERRDWKTEAEMTRWCGSRQQNRRKELGETG
jgi:hypothetical protein